MKKENITVVVKRPGKDAEERVIPNTLRAMQEAVKGYIEVFALSGSAAIICNEEGKLPPPMAPNFSYRYEHFVGPVVFVGIDGEEFDDFPGGLAGWRETVAPQLEVVA